MPVLSSLPATSILADGDQIYVLDGVNSRRITWENFKIQIEAGTSLADVTADQGLEQFVSQPNFLDGQQSWTNPTGGDTQTWNASGLQFDYNPSASGFSVLRTFLNASTTLVAGNRYLFLADVELSGDGETSGLYDVLFNPFVNSSGANYNRPYLTVGQNGASIRHNAVSTFDAPTSGTFGSLYFSLGSTYRNENGNSVLAFDFTCLVRSFQMFDLGPTGSDYYDLDTDYLGDVLARLPLASGFPSLRDQAVDSIRSGFSIRAESAAQAGAADTATQADTLKSSWSGKSLLTVGHSLVSQQGWQAPLKTALGLSTVTVEGISGGTVQPKPAQPTDGFYSRAYWAGVLAALPDDGMGGKVLPDATILWVGANDNVIGGATNQTLELLNANDRIMTTAEQDEFETRNTTDGASAVLSDPLTGGLIPTYRTLMLTAVRNAIVGLGLTAKPEHRMFIVREPQFFHDFDDTLDWGGKHYEKNDVHRTVADYWSLPLIDLWQNTGINLWNRGWLLNIESSGDLFIHLSAKGHLVIAAEIEKAMNAHPFVDLSSASGGVDLGVPDTTAGASPWIVDNTS